MIVSVSRRCDIPRFQFKWFMGRLEAGFVEAVNPFNARQIRRVPLVPGRPGMKPAYSAERTRVSEGSPPVDGVDVFVFWTRDPRNILANAEELEKRGFPFYVMVTVSGYPLELEPSMVRTGKVLEAIRELARKIGPERVIWRYDPILLSSITDEDFHLKNFKALAQNLSGSVRQVIISLYSEYKGAKQRLEVLENLGVLQMIDTSAGLGDLLADLAQAAGAVGMEMQSCASKTDFSPYGIRPGACIDAELIKKLWGLEFNCKDKNQRPNCLCRQSVDIGSYRVCGAHCVYCYAW
jgi:hypothetical protein